MTIDVHAHFVPPVIIDTLAARGAEYGIDLAETEPGCHCCFFPSGTRVRPFFDTILNVDLRLADMERQQIDHQVLTLWTDIFGYELPPDKGAKWHGLLNDSLSRLCEAHSGKFSWMGSGPLNDPARAARELDRTMAAGAVGVIVSTNLEGRNLGECDLDEFWAACCELDAPVFFHPTQLKAPPRAAKYGLNQICAYTNDTTMTVGSMISGGVLDRFPELEIILSHGGGAFPYLVGRFDRMHRAADANVTGNVAMADPSSYLHRFHYDTILHNGAALRYLRDLVGVERLLLGTDVPFPPGDPDALNSLRDAAFTEAEIEKIAEENPRALFDSLSI